MADHSGAEVLQRSGMFAGGLRIGRPACKEICTSLPLVIVAGIDLTLVLEPLSEHILVLEVVVGRFEDARGAHEAVPLPVETTLNHPSQDPGPFSLELLLKMAIRLVRLACEWHDMEAASYGLIYVAQHRLVIADECQL